MGPPQAFRDFFREREQREECHTPGSLEFVGTTNELWGIGPFLSTGRGIVEEVDLGYIDSEIDMLLVGQIEAPRRRLQIHRLVRPLTAEGILSMPIPWFKDLQAAYGAMWQAMVPQGRGQQMKGGLLTTGYYNLFPSYEGIPHCYWDSNWELVVSSIGNPRPYDVSVRLFSG